MSNRMYWHTEDPYWEGTQSMSFISPNAVIEPGVYLGSNVKIYGAAHIQSGAVIEDNCIIGKPSRTQMRRFQEIMRRTSHPVGQNDYDAAVDTPTVIGRNVTVHSGCTIYSGSTLCDDVVLEDGSLIRWDTKIGVGTKIMFGAFIGSYIEIGQYCRIGGFCCNDCKIGDYVTSFGSLTHSYKQYGGGRRDPAPKLSDRVTVGFGVNIVGEVEVGWGSYLVVNATVTKDVPAKTVVTDYNQHHSLDSWKGSLKDEYLASFPEPPELFDADDGGR